MHPRNKLRMLAGLTIDPILEKTAPPTAPSSNSTSDISCVQVAIAELKKVQKSGTLPTKAANKLTDCVDQLTQIAKTLDRCAMTESHMDKNKDNTVTDKQGYTWKVISSGKGEGPEEEYKLKCPKTGKVVTKKAKELLKETELSPPGANQEPTANTNTTLPKLKKGDAVLYDNGIWIVYLTDVNSDTVGIIPPSVKTASPEEQAKSMQQVKIDKLRKPSEEERDLMAGPDGILGTADDVNPADQEYYRDSRTRVSESTFNYTDSNKVSFAANSQSTPVNSVSQSSKGTWANSPKIEYPSQLDNRGSQSMSDYTQQIKVPASVKRALQQAIAEFKREAEHTGTGGTAAETKRFYLDTANAYTQILGYLDTGTVQSLKQAQTFATSLMGPMLHKLPTEVWSFISNGGQKRSLKDYFVAAK